MSKHAPFKSTERRIAKELNGERIGHLGGADVDAGWLSVEVKHRQSIPQWLRDAMKQSSRNARADQLSIVVVHEHGASGADDLVFLTLGDFKQWFGDSRRGDLGDLVADLLAKAEAGDAEAQKWLAMLPAEGR